MAGGGLGSRAAVQWRGGLGQRQVLDDVWWTQRRLGQSHIAKAGVAAVMKSFSTKDLACVLMTVSKNWSHDIARER
jgi:hypothetical protein